MLRKETWQQPLMKKMLMFLGILFGLIFGWKILGRYTLHRALQNAKPVQTVSTMKIAYDLWNIELKSVASIRAIKGVSVTTSLAGMVTQIYYTPGAKVSKGTVLVQLNADAEIGELHALQAQAELARVTYERDKAQFMVHAVSKQQVDSDKWNLQNLLGQIESQAATIEKKTIRAPFDGRVGINLANPGQYLNTGDKVTTLQNLNPIYADFYLPQQALSQLSVGQPVAMTSDAWPGKTFRGKITTIEPLVDINTRNVQVEATLENPREALTPGMYVPVQITIGMPVKFLTLPQSAVTFNPYGELVYIVDEHGKNANGEPQYLAHQQFVTTGLTRGDQIQILTGVKAGDIIVTSGQLKLQNNSQVRINNTIQPANNPAPDLVNK